MFLGIEIGGTKLQLGIGPGDGTLAGLWRGGVDLAAGGAGIRKQINAAVPELLAKSGVDRSQLCGVGFGFGGPVDDATRSILKSHQVGGWEGYPLAAWAEETLGLPAVLGNDADCAALAEALFGAGKGLSPVFYMTIGSGIGGGLVIDGEVYRGAGRGAVEVGHLRMMTPDGLQPLELVASGWAIDRAAGMSGRKVADAVAKGDSAARAVLDAACGYLAEAICHVIALLCPRRIVIGGGVSLMGDVLFVPLRRKVSERVFQPFADCYEIVPAALGNPWLFTGRLPWQPGNFECKEYDMSTAVVATKPVTADEFGEFVHRPENDNKWFELVRGEVIELPPPMKPHGRVCMNIGFALETYVRNRRKGYVTSNDSGVILERDPDTVRGPDVAVYEDALTWDELHPKYGEVPPRLAVEVVSPNDKPGKLTEKIADYLASGVDLVWVIDPAERHIAVYRKGRELQIARASQEVSGEDILPGLVVKVADCFVMPGEPSTAATNPSTTAPPPP